MKLEKNIHPDILAQLLRKESRSKITTFYDPAANQLMRWIREAESADNTDALADYKAQLAAWDQWAESVADIDKEPGFPWPDGDVSWPEQPPKPTRYNPTQP